MYKFPVKLAKTFRQLIYQTEEEDRPFLFVLEHKPRSDDSGAFHKAYTFWNTFFLIVRVNWIL